MRKFIIKMLVFSIVLYIVDRTLGYGFQYMIHHTKGGYIGHHIYITDKCKDDVLIFGSSRAIHHYNANKIADSLRVNCYNCGQDGNGIILNYGNWQMIKNRYAPRIILYDITPDFDYYAGVDNHRYLGWLKMYYNRESISEIFETVDWKESLKMNSRLYQYSYNPLEVICDFVKPIYVVSNSGYVPLDLPYDPLKFKEASTTQQLEIDIIKVKYLNRLIDEMGERTQIVFVVSPIWYGSNDKDYELIKKLCHNRGIKFLDYSNDPKFVHQTHYFADGCHLNSLGAEVFTMDIINQLQNF